MYLKYIFLFRFTNDLFFWSPSFPTPASSGGDADRLSHILDKTRYFAPCKSGIQFGKLKQVLRLKSFINIYIYIYFQIRFRK